MNVFRFFAAAATLALLQAAAQAGESTVAASPSPKASGPALKSSKATPAGGNQAAGTGEVLNLGTGGQGSTIKPIPKPKLDPKVMKQAPAQQN